MKRLDINKRPSGAKTYFKLSMMHSPHLFRQRFTTPS